MHVGAVREQHRRHCRVAEESGIMERRGPAVKTRSRTNEPSALAGVLVYVHAGMHLRARARAHLRACVCACVRVRVQCAGVYVPTAAYYLNRVRSPANTELARRDT